MLVPMIQLLLSQTPTTVTVPAAIPIPSSLAEAGYTAALLLIPLALAAFAWAAVQVGRMIQTNVKNATLSGMLVRLDDAVFTAVKDTMQTLVTSIQTNAPDGKLTADVARKARDAAVAKALTNLGPHGLDVLMQVLGLSSVTEANSYVASRVEAAVHDVKLAAVAAESGAVIVPPPVGAGASAGFGALPAVPIVR